MKYWISLLMFIAITLLLVGCEEAGDDYISDIINTYIVESIESPDETLDFSDLPIEDAMLLKITSEEAIIYENDEDHCEDTYTIETDKIEGVTETVIRFTDGSEIEYSIVDGKLRLVDGGDVIMLAAYNGVVPPAIWTDPTLLTNDTYEPDNDFSTATTIAVGGNLQNHYMGECWDEDYFMFSAISNKRYIMETITPLNEDLDLSLALYKGDGTFLDSDDDKSGTNLNPSLFWICETSGDYYFVVQGFWSDDMGNYSVSVVESPLLVKPIVVAEEKKERAATTVRPGELLFN